MPIFGHTFLAINKSFWANLATTFHGNSGDYYLDRLVMRNLSYDAYFLSFGNFWQENGRGHHAHS